MSDRDSLADFFYLRPAQKGRWHELADFIEGGGQLSPGMREFIGQVLRQKVKRPKHRTPTGYTSDRLMTIAGFVIQAEKTMKPADAKRAAQKEFKVGPTTVRRALELRGWYQDYQRNLEKEYD